MPVPIPTTTDLTAPLLLGGVCNMYLYGILTVQMYMYYLSFPNDARFIKMLVYGVFIIDTISTGLFISDTFYWFSLGFGDFVKLDHPHFSPLDTPILGAFIAAAVQMFYCYRIIKIEKRAWPVSVIVFLIALIQVAGSIWLGVTHFRLGSFKLVQRNPLAAGWMVFGGPVFADSLIATSMTYLLFLRGSGSRYDRTRKTVRKIMLSTAETNIASTIVSLVAMILFLVEDSGIYFTFPSIILGKVYSNSLLLILNNRAHLSEDSQKGSQKTNVLGDGVAMVNVRAKASAASTPEEWSKGVRVEVYTSTHLENSEKRSESPQDEV